MSISLNNIESRVTALENKTNTGIGIGYGQKWYDVTSKRRLNTYYTNTTSIPIMLNICEYSNGNTPSIWIDDIKVASIGGSYNQDSTLSAIIPIGSRYKVVGNNTGDTTWLELRSNNMYYILLERVLYLFKEVISYVNLLK